MDKSLDKSFSESDQLFVTDRNSISLDYVSQRPKRKRDLCTKTDLEDFKNEMKDMIRSYMSTQRQEHENITSKLHSIQQTNHSIENSIAFLMSQNEEYKKQIEALELQTKKDREYISLLEEKLEDTHITLRKSSLEIKNVPRKKQETSGDLVDMVMNLTKSISCPMGKSDIKDIFRVKGKKEGTNPPIIVEINSSIQKREILKMCKLFNIKNKEKLRAKHLGFTTNEESPIFVTEQLTARNARLFFLARDLAKSKSYKYCWTSFGKVYVRKDDASPIILIKNEPQVQHLIQTK